MKHTGIGLIIALAALTAQSATVTSTITPSKQYQTIRAFGGMIYADQANQVNDLVNDLGASIVRFELSGNNTAECQITETNLISTCKNAGMKYFIASNWSSPSQYEKAGNWFDSTKVDAWINWFVGRVKQFKTLNGFDLFGASIQNEPTLGPNFYDVTMYSAADMRCIIRKLGPRLITEGLSTKVLWSEELVSAQWRPFLEIIAADTSITRHTPYYCVHGYDANGVTPASANGMMWTSVGNRITNINKREAWLTETSGWGEGTHWENAMNWGTFMYCVLKYGKLSVYCHHYIAQNTNDPSRPYTYLVEGGQKLPIYYMAKHFWKYIKEGARQLDCVNSDTSIAAPLVFAHPAGRTITLVLLNTTTSSNTYRLSSASLPANLTKYVSADGKNCVQEGTVSSTGDIVVPARTVWTLVGTGYDIPTTAAMPAAAALKCTVARAGASTAGTVSLDGRRVIRNSTAGIRITAAAGAARAVTVSK